MVEVVAGERSMVGDDGEEGLSLSVSMLLESAVLNG